MSELDAKFQVAVDFIAARGNNKLTNEQVIGDTKTRVHLVMRLLTELSISICVSCLAEIDALCVLQASALWQVQCGQTVCGGYGGLDQVVRAGDIDWW